MRRILTGNSPVHRLIPFLALLWLLPASAQNALPSLAAADAQARQERGDIVLVDIRQPEEWRQTGVAEGAVRISMGHPEGGEGFLRDLLAAVGDAMQLQAVSLEFDLAVSDLLVDVENITQPEYARAYRQHGDWEGRERQLRLIRELGELLGETVQKPLVHRLVQLMHGPAVVAGFRMLQEFLRDGLNAFAEMGAADYFLDTISEREGTALRHMRAGRDWPFEEWAGRGP